MAETDTTGKTEQAETQTKQRSFDSILDVKVEVTVRLGSCRMTMRDVLEFEQGTVIQLREGAEDPVLVCVNEKPVARGEVVVVDDKFGLKITEVFES